MRQPIILTDIEGTTSSIDFVKDVLFPYARQRMRPFLHTQRHSAEVRAQVQLVAQAEGLAPDDTDAVADALERWIDEDRKATPLKALQGLIWDSGYRHGDFRAHVYDDAVAALRRWQADGKRIYVYSSGSIKAQQLFFAHSEAGNLTALFSGYFDTTSGGKREADSYRRIAAAIGVPPSDVAFLSDIEAELDAAAQAGMATRWLRRELPAGADPGRRHGAVTSFADLA